MDKIQLPLNRNGKVHKIKIQNQDCDLSLFIVVNKDEEGNVREVFSYERTGHQGELDGLAGLSSIGLRYGVPLKVIVRFLMWRRYEPVGGPGQPSSISDALGRVLNEYLPEEKRL